MYIIKKWDRFEKRETVSAIRHNDQEAFEVYRAQSQFLVDSIGTSNNFFYTQIGLYERVAGQDELLSCVRLKF